MKSGRNFHRPLAVTSAVLMLALGGCGDSSADGAAPTAQNGPGTQTIAALIASADELGSVEQLIEDAGLSDTFDGTAAYTIFAPKDTAMNALDEAFTGEAARPAMIAVLRDHIVPGYLTPHDIATAIEANGGPVTMQTMGTGTLTFAMEGDTITVSAADGEAKSIVAGELLGANGVVIPVEAVLKDFDPAG